ncbi:MAG: hypothetical protein JWP44_3959 [Mucilaginibacter sp.]|nr:hypothetical protein [Mucilaginibacter sp.]
MRNFYLLPVRKLFLVASIILLSVSIGKSQAVYLPYSYQLDQKFNSAIYSTGTSFHTSLKPFLIDSVISPTYNAIMQRSIDTSRKRWIPRKIFNEHLFDVQNKDFTFYGDYLTDFQFGRDISNHLNTNVNTRAYQFGGTVGTKFFFYTSGYENQAKFPLYLTNYITQIGFVPGQAYDRNQSFGGKGGPSKDWSYATAILSYTPLKQLNITLGEDKTFIGDGYRSLLLSDFPANYPLLRLTANVGKVQYMMMWAYLEDINLPKFDSFGNNRRKWAAFHYLDWNVNNRLSLGFFNAVIVPEADDKGNFHGFDVNYINPVLFVSALGPKSSQPDNVLMGFTGKYKIFDKTAVYAQLLLDRFNAGDFFSGNNTNNTNGVQLGIRGADLFKVTNFNYLLEFNTVKPYTYSSTQPISSYTDYSEPLGDPLGANFREFIGILNYQVGRFDFMGQLNYSQFGIDPAKANYGMNVNLPFAPTVNTTTVGQGIATNLFYAQGSVSLLINPKTNLRLELGGIYRDEKNSLANSKTTFVTFGIRSSFHGLYSDF